MLWLVFILWLAKLSAVLAGENASSVSQPLVLINTSHPIHEVSHSFVSISLEPSHLIDLPWANPNFLALVRELGPAWLKIAPENQTSDDFNLTMHQWAAVNHFTAETGMGLLWDAGIFSRAANHWQEKGLFTQTQNHPVPSKHEFPTPPQRMGFVVSCDKSNCSAESVLSHVRNCKHIFPRYGGSLVAGPDMNFFTTWEQMATFENTINASRDELDTISWKPSQLIQETNYTTKSSLTTEHSDLLTLEQNLIQGALEELHVNHKPIWIGDTRFPWEKSSQHNKLSHTFGSALLWLDRLGAAASNGVSVTFKPDLLPFSSDGHIEQPSPEYWVAVLYKRLAGRKALHISSPCQGAASCRLYSHCTPGSRSSSNSKTWAYQSGALTMFGVNLGDTELRGNVTAWSDKKKAKLHQYLLSGDPASSHITLNGVELKVDQESGELPSMNPAIFYAPTELVLPARSMAFWVFPDISAQACSAGDSTRSKRRSNDDAFLIFPIKMAGENLETQKEKRCHKKYKGNTTKRFTAPTLYIGSLVPPAICPSGCHPYDRMNCKLHGDDFSYDLLKKIMYLVESKRTGCCCASQESDDISIDSYEGRKKFGNSVGNYYDDDKHLYRGVQHGVPSEVYPKVRSNINNIEDTSDPSIVNDLVHKQIFSSTLRPSSFLKPPHKHAMIEYAQNHVSHSNNKALDTGKNYIYDTIEHNQPRLLATEQNTYIPLTHTGVPQVSLEYFEGPLSPYEQQQEQPETTTIDMLYSGFKENIYPGENYDVSTKSGLETASEDTGRIINSQPTQRMYEDQYKTTSNSPNINRNSYSNNYGATFDQNPHKNTPPYDDNDRYPVKESDSEKVDSVYGTVYKQESQPPMIDQLVEKFKKIMHIKLDDFMELEEDNNSESRTTRSNSYISTTPSPTTYKNEEKNREITLENREYGNLFSRQKINHPQRYAPYQCDVKKPSLYSSYSKISPPYLSSPEQTNTISHSYPIRGHGHTYLDNNARYRNNAQPSNQEKMDSYDERNVIEYPYTNQKPRNDYSGQLPDQNSNSYCKEDKNIINPNENRITNTFPTHAPYKYLESVETKYSPSTRPEPIKKQYNTDLKRNYNNQLKRENCENNCNEMDNSKTYHETTTINSKIRIETEYKSIVNPYSEKIPTSTSYDVTTIKYLPNSQQNNYRSENEKLSNNIQENYNNLDGNTPRENYFTDVTTNKYPSTYYFEKISNDVISATNSQYNDDVLSTPLNINSMRQAHYNNLNSKPLNPSIQESKSTSYLTPQSNYKDNSVVNYDTSKSNSRPYYNFIESTTYTPQYTKSTLNHLRATNRKNSYNYQADYSTKSSLSPSHSLSPYNLQYSQDNNVNNMQDKNIDTKYFNGRNLDEPVQDQNYELFSKSQPAHSYKNNNNAKILGEYSNTRAPQHEINLDTKSLITTESPRLPSYRETHLRRYMTNDDSDHHYGNTESYADIYKKSQPNNRNSYPQNSNCETYRERKNDEKYNKMPQSSYNSLNRGVKYDSPSTGQEYRQRTLNIPNPEYPRNQPLSQDVTKAIDLLKDLTNNAEQQVPSLESASSSSNVEVPFTPTNYVGSPYQYLQNTNEDNINYEPEVNNVRHSNLFYDQNSPTDVRIGGQFPNYNAPYIPNYGELYLKDKRRLYTNKLNYGTPYAPNYLIPQLGQTLKYPSSFPKLISSPRPSYINSANNLQNSLGFKNNINNIPNFHVQDLVKNHPVYKQPFSPFLYAPNYFPKGNYGNNDGSLYSPKTTFYIDKSKISPGLNENVLSRNLYNINENSNNPNSYSRGNLANRIESDSVNMQKECSRVPSLYNDEELLSSKINYQEKQRNSYQDTPKQEEGKTYNDHRNDQPHAYSKISYENDSGRNGFISKQSGSSDIENTPNVGNYDTNYNNENVKVIDCPPSSPSTSRDVANMRQEHSENNAMDSDANHGNFPSSYDPECIHCIGSKICDKSPFFQLIHSLINTISGKKENSYVSRINMQNSENNNKYLSEKSSINPRAVIESILENKKSSTRMEGEYSAECNYAQPCSNHFNRRMKLALSVMSWLRDCFSKR